MVAKSNYKFNGVIKNIFFLAGGYLVIIVIYLFITSCTSFVLFVHNDFSVSLLPLELGIPKIGAVVPQIQLVYSNGVGSMFCNSYNNPTWNVKRGHPINMNVTKNRFVIHFWNATEQHSGTYTCHGTTDYRGIKFQAQSKVYVGRKNTPIL